MYRVKTPKSQRRGYWLLRKLVVSIRFCLENTTRTDEIIRFWKNMWK